MRCVHESEQVLSCQNLIYNLRDRKSPFSKIMKTSLILLISIMGSLCCGLSSGTDVVSSPLMGKWQIIDERLDKTGMMIVWEFTATEVIVRDDKTGEEISRARYTFDATKSPHWITVEVDDSPNEDSGDRRLGIFRIQDGELNLKQEIANGGERPTAFDGRFSRLKRIPTNNKAEQTSSGKPATRPVPNSEGSSR